MKPVYAAYKALTDKAIELGKPYKFGYRDRELYTSLSVFDGHQSVLMDVELGQDRDYYLREYKSLLEQLNSPVAPAITGKAIAGLDRTDEAIVA